MRIDLPSAQGKALRRPRKPLRKRTVITLASALIPLTFDGVFLHSLQRVRPENETLFVYAPGLMIGISWGLLAVLVCIVLGVLIGLPVALFEAVRHRPGRAASLPPSSEAFLAVVPWLIAFLLAFFLGVNYVFPPVGGPLLMMNTLLARAVPVTLSAAARLWQPVIIEEAAPASPDVADETPDPSAPTS